MSKLFNMQKGPLSLLIRVLGIVALFLLTSCPIKASIKQSLAGDAPMEQQGFAKKANAQVSEDAECFVATSEDSLLLNSVQGDLQIQPFVMLLGFVALFLPFLLEVNATASIAQLPKPGTKGIFLLISRLNL